MTKLGPKLEEIITSLQHTQCFFINAVYNLSSSPKFTNDVFPENNCNVLKAFMKVLFCSYKCLQIVFIISQLRLSG